LFFCGAAPNKKDDAAAAKGVLSAHCVQFGAVFL
jgi:hypothetical protein